MFDSGWREATPVAPAALTWSQWVPGPALAAALEAASPVDVVEDEGFDAAERLAGWEALASWATGRLLRETADYLHARRGRASHDGNGQLVSESVAMEVATLARVAPRTGEIRVHQADMLVERLPETLAALEAGRISLSHARVVVEQTEECDPATARALDAALWSRPPRDRTPTQLRETVRRLLARLDPDAVRRRPEQAQRTRCLRYWSDDDGATGVVQVRLPADQARGVFAVIDAVARTAGDPPDGEKRTLDQKRADTARDLILDAATGAQDGDCCGSCRRDEESRSADTDSEPAAGEPRAGESTAGQHASDDVSADDTTEGDTTEGDTTEGDTTEGDTTEGDTTEGDTTEGDTTEGDTTAPGATDPANTDPANTDPETPAPRRRVPARGLREGEASPVRTEVRVTIGWDVLAGLSQRPAELEGHGPIPALLARRLAADPDATWRRLITDPVTGVADHLESRRYRPPVSLQDFVRSRDLTCAAPGCRVPAARCDLDHVVPYDHGHPACDGGRGRTAGGNLRPCCRRHHRLKTLTDWNAEVAPDPDGGATPVVMWTSPSGHRWWVRSPHLEPPPWERGPYTDPESADADLNESRAAA